MDLPADEDGLIDYVLKGFAGERDQLQVLLDNQYLTGFYPGKTIVEGGVKLVDQLMLQKKDNTALLRKMVEMSDDFLDLNEDMTDILSFFKNQRVIFDNASKLVNTLSTETDYLKSETEATKALTEIKTILEMQKPYRRISELPNLIQTIQNSYGQMLTVKQEEVYADIQAAMAEVHQTAQSDQKDIVKNADDAFMAKKTAAQDAKTLTQLDAMKIQIGTLRQQFIKALTVVTAPNVDTVTLSRNSICESVKLETEADVDKYVTEIKEKLMDKLNGHDVLHII